MQALLINENASSTANDSDEVPILGTGVNWQSMSSSTTWNAAQSQCTADGKTLCTPEEVCPNGRNAYDMVVGGKDTGDKWVPVAAGAVVSSNDWLQVGDRQVGHNWPSCQLHTEIGGGAHGKPSWGTGQGAHGFRSRAPCCGDMMHFSHTC